MVRFRQGTSNKTANNYYTTHLNSYHNGSNGGVNNTGEQTTYLRLANWDQPNLVLMVLIGHFVLVI